MSLVERADLETIRESLARWLMTKIPEATDVLVGAVDVPSASGFSNETIFFDASWREGAAERTASMVARCQSTGPGLYLAADIDVQHAVMSALATHSKVPVPTVLWKEDDPSVLGSRFFVMVRVRGQVPADDPPFTAQGWVLDLDPAERAELCDNGLGILAQIHSLDPGRLGLDVLDRPALGATPLDQEIAYYQRYYEWAGEGKTYPLLDAAFRWVCAHQPTEPEPVVLNWGDARIGNLMFAPDRSVAAVLDWEMASFGSPEQDLGWWLFMHRHHTEGFGLPHPEGFPSSAEVITRYEELSGHTVRHAHFYEAFAALRGSVIMVRLARMMIDAGLLPPDHGMAENNGSSRILATLLGLPAPVGDGIRLISKS